MHGAATKLVVQMKTLAGMVLGGVDPDDIEMLQDLVVSAVTDAIEKAKALQGSRLGAITGGLNLPF